MSSNNKKQCLVLLSGGLDSATVLNIALQEFEVIAISFDYGQRHKFEISAAKQIAKEAKIPFKLIKIDLGQFGNSALTDNIEVPKNQEIGKVTSGTFGPSVEHPIAMGYVDNSYSTVNTKIFLEVRGKKIPANICNLPFYKKNYVKGEINV